MTPSRQIDVQELADAVAERLAARLRPERGLADISEASHTLGLSRSSIERLVRRGIVQRHYFGSRALYCRRELGEIVEKVRRGELTAADLEAS